MDKQFQRIGVLTTLVIVCSVAVFQPVCADKPGPSKAPPTPMRSADILTLLGEGKMAAQLTAHGAYRLSVRLKNVSDEPVEVEFPPGLVADAFAQNQILYQLQSNGSMPPTNPGGTQGSQGMGMMETSKSKLQPGQSQQMTFRTACLNFGVPEPKPSSWLYFKRIEDYSPSAGLHAVLKQIAQQKVETPVAQAALWNLANGLSWDEMAHERLLGGGSLFNPGQLRKSQELVARVLDESARDQVAVPGTEAAKKQDGSRFAFAINPDPRGTVDSAPLVCQAVYKLQNALPKIALSHANYPKPAPDPAKPFVQWGALVQSGPAPGREKGALTLQFTFARSDWNPQQMSWQYASPTTSTLVVSAASANAAFLADQLLAELAGRTIAVQLTPGKKKKLVIANALPTAIRAVTVRDPQNPRITAKCQVELPPMGEATIDLTDEQSKTIASATTLIVSGFELRD